MAQCSEIRTLLQAAIDGELSLSERSIFEQHCQECPACAAQLREGKRNSAVLFEHFREFRLGYSLRQRTLENLPEMDRKQVELQEVNWRAKHPFERWHQVRQMLPALAAGLILCLGLILRWNWPETGGPNGAVLGVVVASQGNPTVVSPPGLRVHDATLREFIEKEEIFETGRDDTLMLKLAGDTDIKMNAGTRIEVIDHRHVRLLSGEAWFDVGRDRRFFKVETPDGGEVTVLGTAFNIHTASTATVVTVARGEVKMENPLGFCLVARGQQSRMTTEQKPTRPAAIATADVMRWTEVIRPNAAAERLFALHVVNSESDMAISALPVNMLDISGARISVIQLRWDPAQLKGPSCGFDVYVNDSSNGSLFRTRVDASAFADPAADAYDIRIPSHLIGKMSQVIFVKLVPLCEGDDSHTVNTTVWAMP